MKTISQVIAELQAIQAAYGDIPFVRYQQATGGTLSEFGHDPDIDIVVEPYQETDRVGLVCIDGWWHRKPYRQIAEDTPVCAVSVL